MPSPAPPSQVFTPAQARETAEMFAHLLSWLSDATLAVFGQRPPEPVPEIPRSAYRHLAGFSAQRAGWLAAGLLPSGHTPCHPWGIGPSGGLTVEPDESTAALGKQLSTLVVPWAHAEVVRHLGISARSLNIALCGGGQPRTKESPCAEFWRLATLLDILSDGTLGPTGAPVGKTDRRAAQAVHAEQRCQSYALALGTISTP